MSTSLPALLGFLAAGRTLSDAFYSRAVPTTCTERWTARHGGHDAANRFHAYPLTQTPSAHTTLSMAPLLRAAQAHWDLFTHAACLRAPLLGQWAMSLTYHQWSADANGTTLFDLRLEMPGRQTPVQFSLPDQDACTHAIEAFITTIQGITPGPHPFTITGEMEPRGGCARTLTRLYHTHTPQDAARLWCAEHALAGKTYPITAINQAHDCATIMADITPLLPANAPLLPANALPLHDKAS